MFLLTWTFSKSLHPWIAGRTIARMRRDQRRGLSCPASLCERQPMPRAIRYTLVIFALLCACGPTADAADASHSASALLRAGWGPNPALLAEAEGAYEAASASSPDARLDYAIALVRLK